MKKILMFVGVGLIILLVLVSMVVGFFIGPIIKTGVETLGPRITQVPVKVDAVGVSVFTGSASVKGLIVGNPSGYTTPEAIKLGVASVSMDPLSVFSKKILVRSIHVKSPEIIFEGGLGGNNLSKIMDNVNAVAKSGSPAASNGNANQPAPKIEIDDFLITGAKVHVNLRGVSSKEMVLSLPDIHLTDLGKDSNGITAPELIRIILSQVTSTTLKTVSKTVTSSGKLIEGLGKDVGNEASGQINTITKGITGLFGK
jgi:uncharacterized protein involved in outer membrane biogenesis